MNKHKHYQQIRAFADGWGIEFLKGLLWVEIHNPSFDHSCVYRIVPDSEGWLPWYGGECPVPPNCRVNVKYVDHTWSSVQPAGWFDWSSKNDIVAYRVVAEEPKPKVKMWQWVLHGADVVFATRSFYKSEEEVREVYGDYKIIQRADWTEIEVEES